MTHPDGPRRTLFPRARRVPPRFPPSSPSLVSRRSRFLPPPAGRVPRAPAHPPRFRSRLARARGRRRGWLSGRRRRRGADGPPERPRRARPRRSHDRLRRALVRGAPARRRRRRGGQPPTRGPRIHPRPSGVPRVVGGPGQGRMVRPTHPPRRALPREIARRRRRAQSGSHREAPGGGRRRARGGVGGDGSPRDRAPIRRRSCRRRRRGTPRRDRRRRAVAYRGSRRRRDTPGPRGGGGGGGGGGEGGASRGEGGVA